MILLKFYSLKCCNSIKSLDIRWNRTWIRCLSSQLENAYKPETLARVSHPQSKSNCPTFSMILPPPNVTGNLHLGHALTATIQDVVVRWKAINNHSVSWIPGTDHAGIATQVIVEKLVKSKLGKTRHDIGRSKFLEEVHKWKHEKQDKIRADLQKMGASLDWSQEYFTMDARQSKAVTEAFIRLFEKGLIYRGEALINWSCSLESAISDIEVDNLELTGPTPVNVPGYTKPITFGEIYDLVYVSEDTNEEIVVSTTRPETFLGDVAVAVHPDDARYAHLQATKRQLWHPIRKASIPLIFDASVDPEFGTGAVKITPGHDKHDYEVAKRHNLPVISMLTVKGEVSDGFSSFSGLPRFEAREKVLSFLTDCKLYKGKRPHAMALPICSRSKDVIEFLLRPQWFVKCAAMASRAQQAVAEGKLGIIPDNFVHEWDKWLLDARDWNISRQLWWGHQIPAYTCQLEGDSRVWVAAHSEAEARSKVGSTCISVKRDQDVLDTWFSSALLPFSVHGWPEPTSGYYPLDLMETGHDILFFWVGRMVMLGQELTGQLPFSQILLHGIICDVHGRKMSKSLGNVISPDQIIDGAKPESLQAALKESLKNGVLTKSEFQKSLAGQQKMFPQGIPACGVDALRFTLCSYNIKNHFINFDTVECHANRLFFNKIWQATRYTLACCEKLRLPMTDVDVAAVRQSASEMDRWILSRLGSTLRSVRVAMDQYNFHLATTALKTFFYANLCDVYLETTKLNTSSAELAVAAKVNCQVLATCLRAGLDNMEPFTPFLAQRLQRHLPRLENFDADAMIDPELEQNIDRVMEVVLSVRQVKSQNQIVRKHEPVVHILVNQLDLQQLFKLHLTNIRTLCLVNEVVLHTNEEKFAQNKFIARSTAGHDCLFGIVTSTATDASSEINQKTDKINTKKLKKLEQDLEKLLKTVNNEGYAERASAEVQRRHAEKISKVRLEIDNIRRMSL